MDYYTVQTFDGKKEHDADQNLIDCYTVQMSCSIYTIEGVEKKLYMIRTFRRFIL